MYLQRERNAIGLQLLLLAVLLFASPALAEEQAAPEVSGNWRPEIQDCTAAAVKGLDPSRGGKYKRLLHTLAMPTDCGKFGPVLDWGYWPGTRYGRYKGLKPGFWVYVYPHWYIYAEDSSEPACPTRGEAWNEAALDGKYARPLRKIAAPHDRLDYGCSYDYGYHPATEYLDQTGIPAGYWVYQYPYWYVFAIEPAQAVGAPPPDTGPQ